MSENEKAEVLLKYKSLLDSGVISEEEFAKAKNDILNAENAENQTKPKANAKRSRFNFWPIIVAALIIGFISIMCYTSYRNELERRANDAAIKARDAHNELLETELEREKLMHEIDNIRNTYY